MKRAWIVGVLLGCAAVATGQTADELVAKNIEAKGGIAKIKAITSLRLTGRLVQDGLVILVSSDRKPQSMVRQTATIQGMTQVRAYDGTEGWQINPFQGRRDPELMGDDELRDLAENADFYGPLIDYKQKGNKIEYIGHEPVDGDDALRLKVTLKNGDTVNYFLDPETFLEIRIEKQMFIGGGVRERVSNLGSYKKVNGVYFPFTVEAVNKADAGHVDQISFTKIEANVAIPDAEFRLPATPKPPSDQKPAGLAAQQQKTEEMPK
jgi:hypothetical protein